MDVAARAYPGMHMGFPKKGGGDCARTIDPARSSLSMSWDRVGGAETHPRSLAIRHGGADGGRSRRNPTALPTAAPTAMPSPPR